MAKELTVPNKALNMMASGKMENIMEQALSHGQTGLAIKADGETPENMVKESLQVLMELFMKEIGMRENTMERDHFTVQTERFILVLLDMVYSYHDCQLILTTS